MSSLSLNIIRIATILGILVLWSGAHIALAQTTGEYQPLTGIPGVTDQGNINLVGYVNALFLLSIALGAMLAVIQIVLGGFTYMMTDVVTKKGDALARIQGALLGLGILLATFVVLWTINPQLTNLDILSGAEPINLTQQRPSVSGNGGNMYSSAETCPQGQEFYKNSQGQQDCRPKDTTSTGNGNAQLCPAGQRQSLAIGVSGSGDSFQPEGSFEYPDNPGVYYTCVPI